jgi:hypothetical protein
MFSCKSIDKVKMVVHLLGHMWLLVFTFDCGYCGHKFGSDKGVPELPKTRFCNGPYSSFRV